MSLLKRAAVTCASVALVGGVAGIAGAPAFAAQPNQSCQNPATSMTPGNSMGARGSAFNPNGVAGTKYAGTQPQNSNNPKSVAQYDVACAQVSTH
ncbi:hypothetical protein [Streptomyces sp. NPDC046821]|uniref:hypothetical protein n=1 Tax=Streptomyces sp. NPDC046821 TaxID=3154702 RepID=UPI0033D916B8